MPSRRGGTLRQGLDREIYQIIRKLADENPDDDSLLTVSGVYGWIQRSNSSLKRKQKSLLQDSIGRVLDLLQAEVSEDEMEPIEGDFGENLPEKPVKDTSNLMNKIAISGFAPSGTSTPIPGGEDSKTKKRDRQTNGEPVKKKRKQAEEVDRSPPSHFTLEDVGGVDNVIKELKDNLILPLLNPQEYVQRKLPIPRGVLLHGPPGCGKTVITRAFAAELGVPFIEILGPSIVSGMSGESEKQIREHFEEAKKLAPCLIFIDEIDVIAPKRDTAQGSMEKRIVAQFLISMDGLALEANDGKPVIVLAATNRPDSLDPALRRAGRFDMEINMGVPNETMRELILRAQTREINIAPDVDFTKLAKKTPGFVGADLRDLVGKAGTWSMARYRAALEQQAAEDEPTMDIDEAAPKKKESEIVRSVRRLIKRVRVPDHPRPAGFEDTSIAMEAFETVLPEIQPSSKREGFATIPDTTWNDIGALKGVREELHTAIVEPIQNPQRYQNVGISAPTGILLWGPPGCGKTLLAKAVANESKANFISVKGPELLNKFVGESERSVRVVFQRARSSVPCVIFFDELDALVPRRDDSLSEASARVVNTLLTELDGLSARAGIYVIAATNRPDIIDPAMLRPGRLETLLFVGLPGPEERVEILRALITKTPIDPSLAEKARECENFSGADLGSLLRKAGQHALKRGGNIVEAQDFDHARGTVRQSVGDIGKYEKLKEKLASRI
ncbi:AAA family ATPase/60S ribosome export protein-like protein Rix7 [Aulographum hederae CBS 113979]|uniref:AAA family ATPase/60S ribosome export protein-like protein Rix7 n=1 Tax=Aulographum hederae CBS 113979 TaxID=1176131 RepID=A0A6G1GWE4_9PEZI|nr:AAA family ATPase/60S ribosome export protein-like protein Rix7 [Aulographum hederae CBS 113979]